MTQAKIITSLKGLAGINGQNILAVNPPVHDFAWFDLWAKPAGLLNFLGLLREQGHRVELIDCLYEARTASLGHGRRKTRRTEIPKPPAYAGIPRRYYRFGLGPEELRARLDARPRPDLALVTSIMTYWYPGVFEAIEVLRQTFPDLPIVLGGIYARLLPEHAAQSGADFILAGPAGRPAGRMPMDLYRNPEYGILSTSYGCPWRCRYCASPVLSPRFTPRPAAEIFDDLAAQMALGTITDLSFYDDALLWKPEERFYPLCEHIARQYPNLSLHTPNGLSVAMIDRPMAEALRRAGFKTLRLSLEGIDRFTLNASGDKAGRALFEKAVKELLAAGYSANDLETYILAGLPGQSIIDIEKSIHFAKSTGAFPKLCEYSPIPRTPMFAEARALYPAVADEPLWHNNTAFAPYLAKLIDPAELQRLKNLCRRESNGSGALAD